MSNVVNLIRAEGITGEKKVFDRDLWDDIFQARQNDTIMQSLVTGVEVHTLTLKANIIKEKYPDLISENKSAKPGSKKKAAEKKDNNDDNKMEAAIPCLVLMHGHIKGLIPVHEAGMDTAIENTAKGLIKLKKIRSRTPDQEPALTDKDQLEIKKRALSALIGQVVAFKVIGLIKESDIFLASRKQAIEFMQEFTWSSIKEGETRTAVVRKVGPRSCILDIGGVLTKLDKKDMSWGWIDDARDIVQVGDNIEIKVVSLDRVNKTVEVSLKELRPKPWPGVLKRYQKGSVVLGRIVGKQNYGLFVNIEPGFDVLTKHMKFGKAEVGDEVSVEIYEMNQEKEEARGIIRKVIKRARMSR